MDMATDPAIELPFDPMPVTTGRSEQVAIRLPHDHIERTKVLRECFTYAGLEPPSTSEVMRAIFARGLEGWEKEFQIEAPKAAANGEANAKR